ncbi:hypothetical protein E2I00_013162, partial [Balaenoptera physalus]
MQPPACSYSLEKDEDTPEEGRHPKAETEQPHLSKKHCQNQGKLLHFDRQAPGRASTSPTLRSCKESSGSPHRLSNGLFGSPEESSHSLWPLRLHSRLPLDPKTALNAADSFELQMAPSDEFALPVLQSLNEGSLPQASLPRSGGQPAPSRAPRLPRP